MGHPAEEKNRSHPAGPLSRSPSQDANLPSSEAPNAATADLDTLSTAAAVRLFREQDARILEALEGSAPAIEAALCLIAARLEAGGRLFYLGAGTSGRLGVLDAVECPPTFQTPPEMMQGILAGGPEAMFRSQEGAEDDTQAAALDLDARALSGGDVVMGISASGTTPFVLGGLAHARNLAAATILVTCCPAEASPAFDVTISLDTGPEVLAGSTRLKAGTATKMALGTISTLVMVKLGRVYGNRMVDVATRGNAKLERRGLHLVSELGRVDLACARASLAAADGQVKVAILMSRRQLSAAAARAALEQHSLREALSGHFVPGSK